MKPFTTNNLAEVRKDAAKSAGHLIILRTVQWHGVSSATGSVTRYSVTFPALCSDKLTITMMVIIIIIIIIIQKIIGYPQPNSQGT